MNLDDLTPEQCSLPIKADVAWLCMILRNLSFAPEDHEYIEDMIEDMILRSIGEE